MIDQVIASIKRQISTNSEWVFIGIDSAKELVEDYENTETSEL